MTVMQVVFIAVAAFTVLAALAVVMVRNLFHASLFLAASFFGVAGIYLVMEAEFLALAQVLIYVGAIATLIVFAIMLSRGMMMGRTAYLNDQWVIAAIGASFLFIALITVVRRVSWPVVEAAVPEDAIARIGELLVTDYVIPFEAASVLLLVALIGAIIIARETEEGEGDGSN